MRAVDNGLLPVQSLVASGVLAEAAGRVGRCGRGDKEHRHRTHLRQSTARGVRRKRGR